MDLITPEEAADIFRLKPSSLRDPRFRQRLGLRAVRIGGSLRFRKEDVERIVKEGLERLPIEAAPAASVGSSRNTA